ncbi:TetR/AcrR family transcriptional regulator [Frankia sp. AgB1.9]|uniref:TetR/AcrR family transcriptional regulator n=1 Tax=unclassified Frankia TaxID=2632575 RepID=UPI0019342B60|nr:MULTISPECIES: TetR/AcrR family transcriptional regulator [unclassified Frankia]MBL7490704.1 TetR/AcrR family transcriptional regulator [Frankia sp. AgW1.1]MBL7547714.1 TetR/AcrR family transcriptional regulator [Frankia sp. AgB1.9]MBL7622644.1 TetR/AcrR family transcriptional regulator [Frankia sp. AgB1.8]
MPNDGVRRAEILDTAATLFADSGLRTTLKDIADACGILAGSLYHHFDSKDAIIVELVRRYQAELDEVARSASADLRKASSRPVLERTIAFGEAIAACAVRHRAALLLTFYEPSAGSSDELVALAARTPTAIQTTMLEIVRAGQADGSIRPGVEASLLADRLCSSMLHVGIGVFHRSPSAARVPAIRCAILLNGIAPECPRDAALDRSAALREADDAIARWSEGSDTDQSERVALIRSAARAEFSRRGYEATTVRDIAATARLSVGSVYRVTESKEHLLTSIMGGYVTAVTEGWNAVLAAPASPVEKLDALMWFNIKVMDRFGEEFRIQFAGLRQSPPESPNLRWPFPAQLRQVRTLLAAGTKTGEVRFGAASADVRARTVFEALWTPGSVVRAAGPRAALRLARDTVLRGAAAQADATEQAAHGRTRAAAT